MIDLTRKVIEFITPPPVELPPMVTTIRPVNILLVEDDANQQEQMALLLRQRHTTSIRIASSVSEALDTLIDADILVLDMVLGSERRGGLVVFRRWQTMKPGQPVLVLSAYMTDEMRLDLLRDGAMNALSKPVGLDVISRVVGNYIYQVQTGIEIENLKASYMALREAVMTAEQSRLRQQRTILVAMFFILLSLIAPNADKLGGIIGGLLKIFS